MTGMTKADDADSLLHSRVASSIGPNTFITFSAKLHWTLVISNFTFSSALAVADPGFLKRGGVAMVK